MDIRDPWAEVSRLYHDALEQPPERRTAFVKESCGGDEALLREVESQLARHADAATFLAGAPDGLMDLGQRGPRLRTRWPYPPVRRR